MRYQRLAVGVLVVAMVAGLAAGGVAQTPAPYVKVFVDSQPVYFDVPPMIVSGRVLVPLRGVFERLGAIVAWDAASQTVLAERGETSVSLRIGGTQAMINGQPGYMDVPALLVSGRTMVPLRFVSQALGAQVSWDAMTTTVNIASQAAVGPSQPLPPSQTYSAAPQPVPTNPVTGTVLQVNAGVYPGQIVVQSGNAAYTYQVVSTTAISRTNVTTGAGGSTSLDAVRPGDITRVVADQNGTAQSVQASYAEVSGVVSAVSSGVIVLQNGTSYRMSAQATVIRNGVTVDPSMLRAGDTVTLRLNPQTNEVWAVAVRQSVQAIAIGSVTVAPSGRQLGPGDVITVVASGPPGGTATFTIVGFRSNLPMGEQSTQPGTYIGTYTVQPGDFVQSAPVIVQLSVRGRFLTANAAGTVSINASASAPPVGAPTITSPASGSTVGIPFTVTGRAVPGTRVKVTADYSGTVLLFRVNGPLGTHIVTADQNGNWSATFNQEPAVGGGVSLTITAVAVDGSGNEISAASTVTTILG